MPLTGNFTFVYIPLNHDEPMNEIQVPKSGGLEQDALLQHVKQYFASKQQQLSSTTTTTTTKTILDTSVNITAVTVPTKDNNYTACSLYSMNYQPEMNDIVNQRATELLTACGHTIVTNNTTADGDPNNSGSSGGGNAIYGDAFCGRAYDDERYEWERLDMTMADIDISADWCRTARAVGGGGGTGRTTPASLSKLAHQISHQNSNNNSSAASNNNNQPMEIVQDPSTGNATTSAIHNYGMDGIEPVMESWGTWIQSNDDIEMKILVPQSTTSKKCQIQFHKNHIKVMVNNTLLLDGTTFDPIAIDESTYTIQDIRTNKNSCSSNKTDGTSSATTVDGQPARELCITIGKIETGRTWMYIAK